MPSSAWSSDVDRKSTRLNSSHQAISYAVFCLKKKKHSREHPHGLTDLEFDSIFTTDKPIIFAFHGYPTLIHRLTYRRRNHDNIHVRGYKEEGTTTTPFDMTVINDLDRFHLAGDVVDRVV